MKYILIIVTVALSFFVNSEEVLTTACLKYKFIKIEEKSSEIILRNIINRRLFEDLEKKYPDKNIDWENIWLTSHGTFTDDNGIEKTFIKACFYKGKEFEDAAFTTSVMKVTALHFNTAFKFYFNTFNELPMNEGLDALKNEMETPQHKKLMEELEKHNKEINQD
jgi:hypothetical protein